MRNKTLLLLVMVCVMTSTQAQSKKSTTAFAITSAEKGQSGWKDVRLVDLTTGAEIQTVFKSGQDIEILNARTGKPVQKKDEQLQAAQPKPDLQMFTVDANNSVQRINSKEEMEKLRADGKRIMVIRNNYFESKPQYDKPFATNSAAMAYDKKHDRLYYTPMGINQLRYIDLKTKKIYYFEDESFGVVKNQADVAGQITRMVIAPDGNGYSLSNDANHLLRFTTGKKPEITDLGALIDNAESKISIHRGVGGDMVADNQGNLYLITAYHNVFKINIEKMTSTHLGAIQGLPEGYQTNGAAVDEENKIVVCSGTSVEAYYRFDIDNLQAEKISTGEVFNASDLANSNYLVVDKKKEDKKKEEEVKPVVVAPTVVEPVKENKNAVKETQVETAKNNVSNNSIVVYPNPVTDGLVRLSFSNQPTGRYNIQVLDLDGKMIMGQDVTINDKMQVQELKLPASLAKGNYLVKVSGTGNATNLVTKLNVQ